MVTVENLHPNKTYNVSATVINSNDEFVYVAPRQYKTLHVYYKPGNITKIVVDKFVTTPGNASLLDAYLSWKPADGKSFVFF